DDAENKNPVAYFRTKFAVAKELADKPAIGRIMNDDAAVVYLNGKEIYRRNLPAGDVTNQYAATTTNPERRYWTFVIDAGQLQEGDNLLAVSVHNRGGVSSDLLHDVELVSCDKTSAEIAKSVQHEETIIFEQFDTGEPPIIASDAEWNYWSGDSMPKDWFKPEFDDSGWGSGGAPLGYVDSDIKTDLAEGKDSFPPIGCFRKMFELTAEQASKPLLGQLTFDDAAAVYINGTEIARYMLPEGELDAGVRATEEINRENHIWSIVIEPKHLKVGKNVVAFSVHQFADSDDMTAQFALKPTNEETLQLAKTLQAKEKSNNLTASGLSVAKAVLVAKKSTWKYWDKDDDHPPKDWKSPDFDDSKWEQGKGPLGYGDDTVATKVSFGKDEAKKNPAVFFRRTFQANDLNAMDGAVAKIMHDDAVIVYLNGEEVFRRNLIEDFDEDADFRAMAAAKEGAEEGYGTSYGVVGAISGSYETHYWSFAIDQGLIRPGKNVLAIRVHQCNPTSSDLAMDFELSSLSRTELLAVARIQDHEAAGDVQFEVERETDLIIASSSTSYTHISDGEMTYSTNGQLYTVEQDALQQASSYAPSAKFARAMEGDTIQKISLKNGLDVDKLMILNRANNSKVFVNREIYLKSWEHVVTANENLDSIAKYYKTTVADLTKLNGFAADVKLTTGQRIEVPGEFQYQSSDYNSYLRLAMYSNRASARVPYDRSSVRNKTYTLKEGEDLATVAKKYKVTEEFLRKMNGLEEDQEAGPRVLVEYSVKPLEDSTLEEIANVFYMNIDEIMDVNGFKSPEDMKPGETLHIPYGKQMGMNRQAASSAGYAVYEVKLGDRKFTKAERPNPRAPEENTVNTDDEAEPEAEPVVEDTN
ncbi:MAG: LysM peptidoglycan-binding domain-containing protein, partial [Planctomycetales bacterium]|nr:LysM peptidoglycan-binding domain-containing protein [Planctomycetales bacterium]